MNAARLFLPASLLYGGVALAGLMQAPWWMIAVFTLIFLLHMVLSGHAVARAAAFDKPGTWPGLAALGLVQLIVVAVVFGAGVVAARLLGLAPGDHLWTLVLTGAALLFSRQLREIGVHDGSPQDAGAGAAGSQDGEDRDGGRGDD